MSASESEILEQPKKKKSRGGIISWAKMLVKAAVLFVVIAVFGPLVCNVVVRKEPIAWMYPNFLMYTKYRETLKQYWADNVPTEIDRVYGIKKGKENSMLTQVPEMDFKDYTFEKLRDLTQNWRYPAVVRGMFKDTPAYRDWQNNPERIMSVIGDYSIPFVQDATYNTLQNGRTVAPFRESYTEILSNKQSKRYLFFPVKSRFSFNHSDLASLDELQKKLDQIVLEDLELERIWPGFGNEKIHKAYFGSQLIAGNGFKDEKDTTGTGWHCAAGNNWFVQVVGKKKWYFMDPEYSSYMHPLRGGQVNMMTGTRNMSYYQQYIPIREVDVAAGDLLYNPDWEWHTIKNYEGLSIGVPLREVNITLSYQNNWHFTTIVVINKFLKNTFGIEIGGYPPN